jgi:hypothetical protein
MNVHLPWASSPTAASTCDVVPVALPVRTSGRRRWRWRCSVDAVTLALCRAERRWQPADPTATPSWISLAPHGNARGPRTQSACTLLIATTAKR